MLITDIKRVIEQVSRDKGIDSEVLVHALEEALKSAARKKFGNKIDVEVKYNEDTGEIEVFQFKEVVGVITDPNTQLSVEEGMLLDPECEIGDSLGTKMDTTSFGRIAAQSAKQVIIQKMKDAEREAVYDTFINRKGEIINGIVQRFERNNLIVSLGQAEAVLPGREQVAGEKFRRGDRVRALIMDVRKESHGPQIILSRTHPDFLISLFRTEVPEVSEGVVKIMGAAREPGSRGKIAVASNDIDIDPVGACVGMKGSRVQNVVQELRGEKIDIISWHIDPAKFVCNALAPAEIARVIIDEENRSMEVIVPDENLSIAIGKRGQNVRLASKLTRWRLDVKSESEYSEDMKSGYDSLMALPNVNITLADRLASNGFFSAEELSKASVEDLMQVTEMDDAKAQALIESAWAFMEGKAGVKGRSSEGTEAVSAKDRPEETGGAALADDGPSEGLASDIADGAPEVEGDASPAPDDHAEENGGGADDDVLSISNGDETDDEAASEEAVSIGRDTVAEAHQVPEGDAAESAASDEATGGSSAGAEHEARRESDGDEAEGDAIAATSPGETPDAGNDSETKDENGNEDAETDTSSADVSRDHMTD